MCFLNDQNLSDVGGKKHDPISGTVALNIGKLHVIKRRDREIHEVDNCMHIVTPKRFHDGIIIAHLHKCTKDMA